jgi:hypothetical protein
MQQYPQYIKDLISVILISDIEKLINRDLTDLEKEKVRDNLYLFTRINTKPLYEEVCIEIKLIEEFYYLLIFNLLN